jgi:ABC-type multidrug transport system fused ATPase/permease subunit
MISLLLSNEADLGLSSIADRPFRRAVVDFNFPTSEIRLSAFFQRPSTISSEWHALLKPFRPQFWIVFLFMILILTLASLILSKTWHYLEEQINQFNSKKAGGKSETFVSCPCNEGTKRCSALEERIEIYDEWIARDCFQWAFSTFCLQGFYKVPSRLPFRILVLTGSMFGILVYSSYSGILVSFLSVVIDPIQNLGQLVSTRYTFAVVDNPIPLQFLCVSRAESYSSNILCFLWTSLFTNLSQLCSKAFV